MDRATLLQIFQSRLERSDYSKLQKQGRTFYQEARRQASNTQARHIYVSSLFRSRRRSVYVIPCVFVFPISLSSPYILSGFVSIFVCSLYMYQRTLVLSLFSWLCRVSWLQTRFFSILRALNYRFLLLVFVCSCVASFLFLHIIHDVSSIVVDLVAFHPNS